MKLIVRSHQNYLRLLFLISIMLCCIIASAQDSTRTRPNEQEELLYNPRKKPGKKSGKSKLDLLHLSVGGPRETNREISVSIFALDLGLNTFHSESAGLNLPRGYENLLLNQDACINVGLRFLTTRFSLYDNRLNLITGLNFDFHNYKFQRNIHLLPERDELVVATYPRDSINYTKNKITMTYFQVPLLLNYTINPYNRKRSVRLSAGPYASLLIHSHTKRESAKQGTEKEYDSFNLNSLQYGVSARVGYRFVELYCNYALNPLFRDGRGPDLHALSFGIGLINAGIFKSDN